MSVALILAEIDAFIQTDRLVVVWITEIYYLKASPSSGYYIRLHNDRKLFLPFFSVEL